MGCGVGDNSMSCKPGDAGSIPGFYIKPLSLSLLVFPSQNQHTNLKPTRLNWSIPRKATKVFMGLRLTVQIQMRHRKVRRRVSDKDLHY